jgi:hypothetical protein
VTATRRNLAAVLDARPITVAERRTARRWYGSAGRHARQIARALDVEHEIGAGIVAAFSVRTSWKQNVEHAHAYARGETPPGLRHRIVMADAVLTHGIDALRGAKTNAFARSIAGDQSAVTVDVWIARAAGINPDRLTPRLYATVVADVTALAPIYGETPRDLQALIWMRARGSAA